MKIHSLILITALMIMGGLIGIAAAQDVCEDPVTCDEETGITADSATSNCCCCPCEPCIAPRTPGYWKNWNRCSGGGQADAADRLNEGRGPVCGNGVYLLDDLLPLDIGCSLYPCDGCCLTIDNCEDAIAILSAQDLDNSKNMNNDAAYKLARDLLAARLNLAAGACEPGNDFKFCIKTREFTLREVLCEADYLLYHNIGFDGTGNYLGPKNKDPYGTRAYAISLHEIIDKYNNGEYYTGE